MDLCVFRCFWASRGVPWESLVSNGTLCPCIRKDPWSLYPSGILTSFFRPVRVACGASEPSKKHVPGFLVVSQGRNRGYFLIFPQIPPSPSPSPPPRRGRRRRRNTPSQPHPHPQRGQGSNNPIGVNPHSDSGTGSGPILSRRWQKTQIKKQQN